jgi:hypothetical protein
METVTWILPLFAALASVKLYKVDSTIQFGSEVPKVPAKPWQDSEKLLKTKGRRSTPINAD